MRPLPIVLVFVLGAAAGAARAEEATAPPARCFADPGRWAYDRGKETLAAPGERFLDDVRACDPTFAAAIVEAVRYRIHDEETQKFVRARGFVWAAYGVAWGLLAVSGLLLWLRQRRLTAEIAALEAKVRAAERP